MNRQLSETDSSTWRDKYVEDHINKLRSWQARHCQKHMITDIQVQNNKFLNTSSKPIQQHKAQQTDDLHFDGQLLYTMIGRLNAVFTQLITEIQKHCQIKSYMPQTVHPPPPFHKNYRRASRRRNRRSREKKCHRYCLYGHRAADCGTSLPRQHNQYAQNNGYTTSKIIKTEPDSSQDAFPQYIPKTIIKYED